MLEVIDNAISTQDDLESTVLNQQMSWYYDPWTIHGDKERPDNKYQFAHHLIIDAVSQSAMTEYMLQGFQHLPEFKDHILVRAKINMNLKYPVSPRLWHKDSQNPNAKVYIYYFHDTDGPTLVKRKWWKRSSIQPKKGRLLKMPAYYKHCSSMPKHHDRRIVLNLLFEPTLPS